MSASPPRPTVVLVHGAWHTPSHYTSLITRLQPYFNVVTPTLPTSSNDIPPKHSLADDTSLIHSTLLTLSNTGTAIILLMHSYGGAVGSNSLASLSYHTRSTSNLPGGVVHLIYMAAFTPPLDTSLTTNLNNQIPPWLTEDKSTNTVQFKDPRNGFYNDLSDEEAQPYLDMLVACPTSVLFDSVSYTPYGPEAEAKGERIASTYLVCERDTELTREIQEGMAVGVLGGGDASKVRIERVDGGHCAFIAKPEEVASVVERCWEVARKEFGL